MPVIAVVNRKGGSGKSTLSTNIAAWCAQSGWRVMLGDIDRQQSLRSWLQRRPAAAPPITTWAVDNGKVFRAPRGTTHVVLDTPGALYDYEQSKLLVWLDAIVVPIGPSLFDREASLTFLNELRRHPRVSSGKCKIAVIGMRWPTEALARWRDGAGTWEQSLLTVIPEDPRYRVYLDNGSSVFDEFGAMTPQDRLHWAPLLQWLDHVWTEARPPAEQAAAPARQTGVQARDATMADVLQTARSAGPDELEGSASSANVETAPDQAPTVAAAADFIPAYLLRAQTRVDETCTVVTPGEAMVSEASMRSVDVPPLASATVAGACATPCPRGLDEEVHDTRGCTNASTSHAPPAVGMKGMAAEPVVAEVEAVPVREVDTTESPQKDKGWLTRWFKLA